MSKSGSIALTQNVRFEIYYNKYREDMRAVWNRTHPSYLFSGPFFSYSTFNTDCHMKIHGVVKAAPPYGEWGFAWNDGEQPQWAHLPCNKDNYFTNTVLMVNGARRDKNLLTWHPDSDGTPSKPRYTSRPLYGLKNGSFVYDIRTCGVSLPGAQNLVAQAEWEHAIMSDGGGSTMYKDTMGNEIYSKRIIPYYILVYIGRTPEPEGAYPMNVTIKAYSLKKEGNSKLSDHFKVREFACPDGSDTVFNAPQLMVVLESIRKHFGNKPLLIHRGGGYRTAAYNAKQNDAVYSQHQYGTAADISIKGVTPRQLAAYVETLMPNTGGIGVYDSDAHGHFVHVDVREKKARW